MKKPKRPRDVNQLAKYIVDLATEQIQEPKENQKAQSGRLGGLKGGSERARKLTAEQRSAIARRAAKIRWEKGGDSNI